MADQFAVASVAVPSAGTFDITAAGIDEWDQNGVMYLEWSYNTTNDANDDHGAMGRGFVHWDGSAFNQASIHTVTEDGGAVVQITRFDDEDARSIIVQQVQDPTPVLQFEATPTLALTNGCRFTVNTGTLSGFQVKAWIYATSGGSIHTEASESLTSSPYNGASFEADVMIGFSSTSSDTYIGFVANTDTLQQGCMGSHWRTSANPTDASQSLKTDAFLARLNDLGGSPVAANYLEIDSMTATGFNYSFTTSGGGTGGTIVASLILIQFEDTARSASVALGTLPSSTGSQNVTGLDSFTPETILGALTAQTGNQNGASAPANNPIETADAGTRGIVMMAGSTMQSSCSSNEIGLTPSTNNTNAQSRSSNANMVLLNDDATVRFTATSHSFITGGFEATYGTATASQILMLGISRGQVLTQVDEVAEVSETPMLIVTGPPVEFDTEVVEINEGQVGIILTQFFELSRAGHIAKAGGEAGAIIPVGIADPG